MPAAGLINHPSYCGIRLVVNRLLRENKMNVSVHSPSAVGRWSRERDSVEAEKVLAALDDAACRTILEATGAEPMIASEIAAACEIPQSTTYRKLKLLTDAGLLEEQVRVRPNGKHISEYVHGFEDIVLSVSGDDGLAMEITLPDSDADPVSSARAASAVSDD